MHGDGTTRQPGESRILSVRETDEGLPNKSLGALVIFDWDLVAKLVAETLEGLEFSIMQENAP